MRHLCKVMAGECLLVCGYKVVLCPFLRGELCTSVCISLSLIMKALQQAATSSTILILHFYILLTFTGVLWKIALGILWYLELSGFFYPLISEAGQLLHKHKNNMRRSLFPSTFSGNSFLLPILFISPFITLFLLAWNLITVSNTPRF